MLGLYPGHTVQVEGDPPTACRDLRAALSVPGHSAFRGGSFASDRFDHGPPLLDQRFTTMAFNVARQFPPFVKRAVNSRKPASPSCYMLIRAGKNSMARQGISEARGKSEAVSGGLKTSA